jgi:hypothetical protein
MKATVGMCILSSLGKYVCNSVAVNSYLVSSCASIMYRSDGCFLTFSEQKQEACAPQARL